MSYSLAQIELGYGRDVPGDTELSVVCYKLRRKPIDGLTTEELRLLIGQNLGLVHLLPLALARLEENPLISGDMFDCDLLYTVVNCKMVRDGCRPDVSKRVAGLCRRAVLNMKSKLKVTVLGACACEGTYLESDMAESLLADIVGDELAMMPWDSIMRFADRFR